MKLKRLLYTAVFALMVVSCGKDDGPEPTPDNTAPEIGAQTFSVKEDVTDSQVIETVVATDDDGDALTFSITTNDNDLFQISKDGKLSLAGGKTLSFATSAQHVITVSVYDGEATASAKITIDVIEVPDLTTITLDKENLELYLQSTDILVATVTGEGMGGTVVWSSTNENVATVDQNGNVTAVNLGTAQINAVVDDKTTSCTVTVNPDIYVAGSVDDNAVYWKNGEAQVLIDDATISRGSSIYVDANNSVYVATNTKEGNLDAVAHVYKDGAILYTIKEGNYRTSVTSLFVTENLDVYAAGRYIVNGIGIAAVWKNGTILYSIDGMGYATIANDIFVTASDEVYFVGRGHDPQNAETYSGIVWKDGEELYALNDDKLGISEALSLSVSGSDVYVGGYEDITGSDDDRGKVWKNGELVYTIDYGTNSRIYDILAEGTDVYFTGYYAEGGRKASVWKNGNLDVELSTGTSTVSDAFSLNLFGYDVWVAGTINNQNPGMVWRNGDIFTSFEGEGSTSTAWSIFVKN